MGGKTFLSFFARDDDGTCNCKNVFFANTLYKEGEATVQTAFQTPPRQTNNYFTSVVAEGGGAAGKRKGGGDGGAKKALWGSGSGGGTTRQVAESPNSVGDIESLGDVGSQGGTGVASTDPILVISNRIGHVGEAGGVRQVAFTHRSGGDAATGEMPGVDVRVFDSEREMLEGWRVFVSREVDPDVICVFQLKHSLKYILDRWHA